MLNKTLNILERIFPVTKVQAHCDIPYGINVLFKIILR